MTILILAGLPRIAVRPSAAPFPCHGVSFQEWVHRDT